MAAGVSGAMTVLVQAARSIVLVDGGWPRLCQPSTLRMVVWPEASNARNSMAAVSALKFGAPRNGQHGYLVFEDPSVASNQRLVDGPALAEVLALRGWHVVAVARTVGGL